MKRFLYLLLLAAMLSMMAFPLAIFAADDTRTPFDYLNEKEQAYVNTVRSLIAEAKAKVDTARTDLQTFFLQDYQTWYYSFLGELDAVNSAVSDIRKTSAPSDFSDFGQQCQSMAGLPSNAADIFLNPAIAVLSLVEAAQTLGTIEGHLNQLDQRLDGLSSSLEQRVEEVAEAQKRGEELLNEFLSCEARPARHY